VRVTKPGGKIALNFRARSSIDRVLLPLGSFVRWLFGIPGFGPWLSRRRTAARVGWQANRLHPDEVIGPLLPVLTDVQIWLHPKSRTRGRGAESKTFEGINPHHYWVVATVR
jgi:hypothetical protein